MDIMEQLNAFWPIILMVVIFYFLLWRPQKKQQKKRQEMLESLKPGAKIVTVGGVMGNIVSLHDDYLIVRIADKVEIKITRAAVAQVLGKGEGKKAAKKAEKAAEKAEEKAPEAKADVPAETKAEAASDAKEAEGKDAQ
ncbi:preprotein translocase subunit YajC [Megasphaera elsdenii]|uniref:Preprotein translocase n=1 Tax=Megasphaera elsdenii DSM 20460 TaxID=1064535 RepID=G0VPU4_MEGEL|nr:preprotein translocase subunit YajC [Megasphaera elsdenii DSM 20460]CCC73472.1 preprotein translocase [Megasphaera elsdenii DSM 20460]